MPADRTQIRVWVPSALSDRLTRHAIASHIAPWRIVRDALARYLDEEERPHAAAPRAGEEGQS